MPSLQYLPRLRLLPNGNRYRIGITVVDILSDLQRTASHGEEIYAPLQRKPHGRLGLADSVRPLYTRLSGVERRFGEEERSR